MTTARVFATNAMIKFSQVLAVLICESALLATSEAASAQEIYPNRRIKLVVPVAAGGAPDVVARIVADKLGPRLGQPVVIENKPGAGERIGAEFVARSEPDGYTLLAAPAGTLVISRHLFTRLPFEPEAFVPVTVLVTGHLVLVASSGLQISSVKELVARAGANPGKLTYASSGVGTPPHLIGEMFKLAAGIQITHIPYKGLAPALVDMLAGHVDVMFDNLGNSRQYIDGGHLKALAIAGPNRIAELPDVQAIAETYPGVRATSWFGVVAPPKTSPEIASRLARDIAVVLRLPDVVQRLRAMTFAPVGSTPGEMTIFLKEESQRWRSVVKAVGIKPE